MKKYLYIELSVTINGEYEEYASFLKVTKAKDINKVGESVAENHYGFDYDEELDGYSDGQAVVNCIKVQEIPESDFEVLKKYIKVLDN